MENLKKQWEELVDGKYLIFPSGEVCYAKTMTPVKPYKNTRGHLQVTLSLTKGKTWQPTLGRLVFEIFIGYKPGRIKYKDGNPMNIKLENLEEI